ncbi:MAG: TlpA family protein disulfide reductase [Chloroflexi bacterium]|nr:TlpA family protein disulfide reductase [Chloroflexota bacterium]
MAYRGGIAQALLIWMLTIIFSGCSTSESPAMESMILPEMPPSQEGMGEEISQIAEWLQVPLTDVRSGEVFTLAGFKGRVVLVEMMAVWCPNCLDQQLYISALKEQLDNPDLVLVSLDIDPTESELLLKRYVARQGFTWAFALASPEVAREIATLYGNQFLNPPSTPMLLIDREGVVHPLQSGIKNVDALLRSLENYL